MNKENMVFMYNAVPCSMERMKSCSDHYGMGFHVEEL